MYKWIARNHEGSSNVINDRTKWIYIYNGLLHCPTKLPDLSSITTQPPSRPCSGNSHLLIGLQWMICKGRRSTTTTWEGRSLGGVGGRKEPAASTTAGACSWWGSFNQWGVIPRIMAGSGLMERAECYRHQHLWVFERGRDRLSSLQNLTQGGAHIFQKILSVERGPRWRLWWPSFGFEAGASERRGHWRLARFFFLDFWFFDKISLKSFYTFCESESFLTNFSLFLFYMFSSW